LIDCCLTSTQQHFCDVQSENKLTIIVVNLAGIGLSVDV